MFSTETEEKKKKGGKKLIDWAKKRLHLVKQSPYSKLEDQPVESEELATDHQFNLNELKAIMSSPVRIKV